MERVGMSPPTKDRRLSRRTFLRAGVGATLGAGYLPLAGRGMVQRPTSSRGDATLSFSYWGTSFEKAAVAKMLQRFANSHPGITTQPIYVAGDYDTKINTLVAANTPPDMGYMDSLAWQLAESGKLFNIYPYFKKYPQLAQRLPSTYFWWDHNKTYGAQTAVEVMVLWYNKDLIQQGGVETPPAVASRAWTMDRLRHVAEKLTLDENGKRPSESGFNPSQIRQYGILADPTNWQAWYPLLKSNGGDVTDPSGKRFTLNEPPGVKVLQDLQDLIHKYHVAPTPAQLGNNAPTTTVQLQTRRMAMVVDGQWNLLDMAQGNLHYGIGVLPSYQRPATMQLGGSSVIFHGTKHPHDTLELYLYHNDPRHVDLFKDGLWMPLETKYYTEEKYIKLWAHNRVHPPEYRTAVIDYTLHNSITDYHHWLKNQLLFDQTLTPALQVIAEGKQSAKEVLDGVASKMQSLLHGVYPTQQP